jgi:hypothetical protein
MTDLPDELRNLDRRLRSVRFVPRMSLGPELAGRLRRGDSPSEPAPRRFRRQGAIAAIAILTVGGALALLSLQSDSRTETVTVDRCCYDLDGGVHLDDGVLVLAERNARVHRLRVYEDLDGSRSFTPGDLVRLDRGREPTIHGMAGRGLVTIEQCCLDFDGGGPADDGLLIVGVPPDRVVMAAIYESSSKSRSIDPHEAGWPLR